jgi:hypothetical protein
VKIIPVFPIDDKNSTYCEIIFEQNNDQVQGFAQNFPIKSLNGTQDFSFSPSMYIVHGEHDKSPGTKSAFMFMHKFTEEGKIYQTIRCDYHDTEEFMNNLNVKSNHGEIDTDCPYGVEPKVIVF